MSKADSYNLLNQVIDVETAKVVSLISNLTREELVELCKLLQPYSDAISLSIRTCGRQGTEVGSKNLRDAIMVAEQVVQVDKVIGNFYIP